MLLNIKKITKSNYKGLVYDLTFDKDKYFYIQHENTKTDNFVKVHNRI